MKEWPQSPREVRSNAAQQEIRCTPRTPHIFSYQESQNIHDRHVQRTFFYLTAVLCLSFQL